MKYPYAQKILSERLTKEQEGLSAWKESIINNNDEKAIEFTNRVHIPNYEHRINELKNILELINQQHEKTTNEVRQEHRKDDIIRLYDIVELTCDKGLFSKGERGTVIHIYHLPASYEVEFVTAGQNRIEAVLKNEVKKV